MRTILNCCIALAGLTFGHTALSQESPGKHLAALVAVALDEYRLGIDSTGKIISHEELAEAREFFRDAAKTAAELTGANAARVRVLVDSLGDAVRRNARYSLIDDLHARFVTALGPDAVLDLPTRPVDLAAGSRVYTASCASCHGAAGRGDGPAAAGLNPPPAVLADVVSRKVEPSALHHVISVGIRGTAMAGWSSTLDPDQRWDVIAYIYTLNIPPGDSARAGAMLATLCPECMDVRQPDPPVPSDVPGAVATYMDRAIAALGSGDFNKGVDNAIAAYVAFDPLERELRGRDPAMVRSLEAEFLAFRGAIRVGNTGEAATVAKRVNDGVHIAADLVAQGPATSVAVFGQSLLIVLREGFEAILIIGAIVTLLLRTGHRARIREVWIGSLLALAASAATAFVLQSVLRALPATREMIEGVTMLVAVVVLFSVSYWILSKVESDRWQAYVQQKVNTAVTRGGRATLMGVAFLVVYREGAETVLFYQALLQAGAGAVPSIVAGFVVGAAVLVALYMLVYRFGVRVPLRPFFAATGTLLYLMAFVFVGKGLRELQEGGALPVTPLAGAPTIDALGVYPTVETLAGQWLLFGLFVLACWHSFVTPRLRASRKSRDVPVPSSSEPASTTRPRERKQARSSAPS